MEVSFFSIIFNNCDSKSVIHLFFFLCHGFGEASTGVCNVSSVDGKSGVLCEFCDDVEATFWELCDDVEAILSCVGSKSFVSSKNVIISKKIYFFLTPPAEPDFDVLRFALHFMYASRAVFHLN